MLPVWLKYPKVNGLRRHFTNWHGVNTGYLIRKAISSFLALVDLGDAALQAPFAGEESMDYIAISFSEAM